MKLPSFQFYPGDWRKDPNLARASLQAKGALIEILCLAFECENRGYLQTGKKPWTIDEIAMAIGGDKELNTKAILELLEKKILKTDKNKGIFSARMVRDAELIKKRSEGGKLGAVHGYKGKEFGKLGGRPVKKPPLEPPLKPSPSSSSSSSSSISLLEKRNVFEFLRVATNKKIPDETIDYQADELIKKYNGKPVHNLRALCNEWASNIEVPVKRLIL